ncbi:unnamed protein product [Aspergillus oryzae]|uniref:Unnamed protein product n=1 Tax=Aspergillus oryzae TaxID=5062 RepID=A0AAN4YM56_ASPOZ|nr:unnamed protein product [Aspergillus oryzae]GMF91776.1 unnamed protein product [Aspergillus oryzae]GMG04940.1 unnamed protein product [Aspergillus oryzae]GMG31995.1 unnamed protein product [Aspergillus oryzae]
MPTMSMIIVIAQRGSCWTYEKRRQYEVEVLAHHCFFGVFLAALRITKPGNIDTLEPEAVSTCLARRQPKAIRIKAEQSLPRWMGTPASGCLNAIESNHWRKSDSALP